MSRTGTLLVVVAALAVAGFGLIQLLGALRGEDPLAHATTSATTSGLTSRVESATWADVDHGMSTSGPGFQMPPQMMPGMPADGEQRLALKVSVVNSTGDTSALRPTEEFTLRAGTGDQNWKPISNTFGEFGRLPGGNAVNGILYFDVRPEIIANSTLWLEWNHQGTKSALVVPLNGAKPPEHSH